MKSGLLHGFHNFTATVCPHYQHFPHSRKPLILLAFPAKMYFSITKSCAIIHDDRRYGRDFLSTGVIDKERRLLFMAKIALYSDSSNSATSVSNIFIDEYMSDANGEFVKIYLYLLRLMNMPDASFSISSIADKFDHTEKDIKRALCYWERMQLLRLDYDANQDLTGVHLLDSPYRSESADTEDAVSTENTRVTVEEGIRVTTDEDIRMFADEDEFDTTPALPEEKTYSLDEIKGFRENDSIAELLFIIERYLGRPLSANDLQKIFFLYDGLHFSTDLIEYLVESCVGNGHKSIPYIYKAALRWAESGITTVDEAKQTSMQFNRSYYTVMNSFGLSGSNRNLTPDEIGYLKKWTGEYGFSDELIAEACRRTIDATSRPSFKYADSILNKWHSKQVHHLSDLDKLDLEHSRRKAAAQNTARDNSKNKFNNFTQRSYDYDELEQMLLSSSAQ